MEKKYIYRATGIALALALLVAYFVLNPFAKEQDGNSSSDSVKNPTPSEQMVSRNH